MKVVLPLLVSGVLMSSAFGADKVDVEKVENLKNFVAGTYQLIGQWPDSPKTYSGKVILSLNTKDLTLTRIINGKTIKGTATIDKALGEDIEVLRMRFSEGGKAYESTCLIKGDLDNYARLTCKWYLQKGNTKKAGLEALFIAE